MAVGFRTFNSSGSLINEINDYIPYIVWDTQRQYSNNGTVSVPKFDDTKHMFFISLIPNRVDRSVVSLRENYMFSTSRTPKIDWNNTTKVMTFSHNSYPSGWPSGENYGYLVNVVSTEQRIDIT